MFMEKNAFHISFLLDKTSTDARMLGDTSEIFRDRRRKQMIFLEKLSATFSC